MTGINGKSVFDSAMQLRNSYVLKRDDDTDLYIDFMNLKQWCQNKFK